ncbi:cysteine synthase family protein [Clostridium sp. SHJSY1]|uniref:PLP-dependent cysteine synthase family protein n=1 Tax=Clostridium sp. SHJSY1 TaxID=2942483 RepID=UPI002874DFB6|nr:cysteine synthase family protein [Clostridium sp. SHJSY1]MDS0524783.1 cysteine synthase family protein [Clostridium sp. SHJSY1]
MKYINDIRELIGKTPLIKLNYIKTKKDVNIFAKLEYLNPGGSVKDRIGISMIEGAEKRGELKKGDTIIDATAGNTGIGIALAAINRGYNVIFIIPLKFSEEKQKIVKVLGAKVINTPKENGMLGAVEKAEELLKEIPNSISLKQFANEDNPLAHYEGTGAEIYEALGDEIDYFIAGAGSGGTFSGVARYLKSKNPKVKGVLADPIGSTMVEGEHGDYEIEGIGNDFVPQTMDLSLVDRVIKVSDNEAFEKVKLLAKKEGMIVGSSSGAALAVALKLADEIDKGNIVTIFPDSGDRYISKGLFDD